jgi:hypothetical protein
MKKAKIIFSSFAIILAISSFARENKGSKKSSSSSAEVLMAICTPGASQTDLDINNVRTTILTSGDMWWDLTNPKYEIPKGSGVHSIFSGALWIGGIDAGSILRVAAMTYRQTGVDFWPGPLDEVSVSTTSNTVCKDYDKHYKITRKEVEDFLGGAQPSDVINDWPATSIFGKPLAPFYDSDNDGIYSPSAGDYPDYDIYGTRGCDAKLYGDQTLFWVFNDKGNGNPHTESSAPAIGLEIQAQAFGFQTTDEINNMTFYNYTIINRSSNEMHDTYFGQWVDSDLGYAFDDYVGCDVRKGLGYTYNGVQTDGNGAPGEYGANPPALGIDFFQGPFADNNGIDDPVDVSNPASANGTGYGDAIIDNERLGMVKFVYYNNVNGTANGNPDKATDFYNFLSGLWIDGTPFQFGGDAYQEPSMVDCSFMFPGDSDPLGFGTAGAITGAAGVWSEETVPNLPDDRRFLQSAGPFTLNPGDVNTITTGAVWARATTGGPTASVSLLKSVDTKAQALFDNCFALVNGPDAPDVNIIELDKTLIFNLSNQPPPANNFNDTYKEKDPYVKNSTTYWTFEGYQIYQLKDASVSQSELYNPDRARLVKQSDIKNNVSKVINYDLDQQLGVWVPQLKTSGTNEGIENSFIVTQDLFAQGDNKLVNYKTYYYMAVAYGYNPAEVQPNPYASIDGLNIPYLEGRRNVKVFSAIPHNQAVGGNVLNTGFGDGPKITRVEGHGNGNRIVDLTQATVNKILSDTIAYLAEYEGGRGPIKVTVIDPLNLIPGDFTIKFRDTVTLSPTDTLKNAYWTIFRNGTTDSIESGRLITIPFEKVMTSTSVGKWGFSVDIYQPVNTNGTIQLPAKPSSENAGFLEATMTFSNNVPWLTGVADVDGATSSSNWIRSGEVAPFAGFDDNKVFQTVLGGTWAPFRLAAQTANMPGYNQVNSGANQNRIQETTSIDVVITPDKSKWSRCVVIETSNFAPLPFSMRAHKSVDKNGDSTNVGGGPENSDYINATGMGWFPGYVINVSTGERLNIAFGEDSSMPQNNGNDMIWNPTDSAFRLVPPSTLIQLFGGKHFIYTFGHNAHSTNEMPRYDEGKQIWTLLNTNTTSSKRRVFEHAMWTNIPLAATGVNLKNGIPSEVKIRLRMSGYFQKGYSMAPKDSSLAPQNNNLPMYNFSTSELVAKKNDETTKKNAMDLINIVPNPYYAYSAYETNQVDNRVKITNLPTECTVKIFTVNGTLIRTYKKSDAKTYLDWDLKNQANIPIASGLYIIHINVPGLGEKILKWFGVLRPIDLDSF